MDDLLLYKFLQNEASEDEIRTVLDWLDADPANRKYFDGLDNMLNAARVNRPAGRKPLRRPLPSLRSIGAWSMRIAAVLCLCLGVSYFAATKMFDRKASNNSLSVFVPNGERISMTLTDGTTVWLNSGTTLEYPAVFAETFACDVRVLGTKFNVEANEEKGIFSADLLRGKVQVCNRTDRSDRITMEPNQTVHLENGKLQLHAQENADKLLWTDGILCITGMTFEEVMAKFERCYDINVEILRDDLPQIEFQRCKLRISEGIDHALAVLQHAADFRYERDITTNTLYIR
ncbi:MAG: RNA polymerase subunit sigma [Alistipes sp. 58_9_plus]|nr:MAG: RNA polymerase subunit sigma [Alistipes sp. 58_9_plus]